MKQVILVSHGNLAAGLESALRMLAGKNREDLVSVGLKEERGADGFIEELDQVLAKIGPEDEVLLYGDIIGGSPLTTAANEIANHALLDRTIMVGGISLPFVLASLLTKDAMDSQSMVDSLLADARGAMQQFVIQEEIEEDEI